MLRIFNFVLGSVLAQGLAALSGLLFARWMSVESYGLYTIVTTIMGALTLLSKGGVHIGYSAILGRVWPDRERTAEVIEAALQMRRLISVFVVPTVLAVGSALLLQNKATPVEVVTILALLIAFWWADMRTRLVDQVLFFAKQTTRVQTLDAFLALLRVLIVIGLYLTGYLNLITAVGIGVVVAVLRVQPILHWIRTLLKIEGKPTSRNADLIEIRAGVMRQLPVEFYYVMQTQIVLAMLSFFGSVNEIAGFGALTRINQLLLPVEAFTYAFFIPAFSSATLKVGRLYFRLLFLTMVPGMILVAIARFSPWLLLSLVGPSYRGLEQEIFIAAAVALAARGAHTAWNLLAHRGWVRFSWIQIPVGLLACAFAPFVLDLGTVSGALYLQLCFALGLAVAASADFFLAYKRGEMR